MQRGTGTDTRSIGLEAESIIIDVSSQRYKWLWKNDSRGACGYLFFKTQSSSKWLWQLALTRNFLYLWHE